MGVEILEEVWRRMPSFTLWKWARATKMAEIPEMAEKARVPETVETAEPAEMGERVERVEVGGESAVDRWCHSEEHKALVRVLVNVKDAKGVEGVDQTEFHPRAPSAPSAISSTSSECSPGLHRLLRPGGHLIPTPIPPTNHHPTPLAASLPPPQGVRRSGVSAWVCGRAMCEKQIDMRPRCAGLGIAWLGPLLLPLVEWEPEVVHKVYNTP